MGLCISHNCFTGPYSCFTEFRNTLAIHAGYTVIEELCKNLSFEFRLKIIKEIDWNTITKNNLNGNWFKLPKDPLMILFCHYDDHGRISKRHTKLLQNRMIEIYEQVKHIKDDNYLHQDFIKRLQQFINGLQTAIELNQSLRF